MYANREPYTGPSKLTGMPGPGVPINRDTADAEESKHKEEEQAKLSIRSSASTPPTGNRPTARTYSGQRGDTSDGLWLPSGVVKPDRFKANLLWIVLLCGAIAYITALHANAAGKRKNSPINVKLKEELFRLPDVAFCPAAGDGCDSESGEDCAQTMRVVVAALSGFAEDADELSEALAAERPAVSSPTPAPTVFAPDDILGRTPAPVPLPSVRLPVETTGSSWCPVVPFSSLTLDMDGIESGDVRSLHASIYVVWADEIAVEPIYSTRRLINMFFLDDARPINDTVVAGRLPYEHVAINESQPFMALSNDVTVGLTEYVRLRSNGKEGDTERTYSQATVSGQQILRLDDFEGTTYEGAFLYTTFNINEFVYQSAQEVDPVDMWSLLGSAGGIWGIMCIVFGVCFVAHRVPGPGKKWRITRRSRPPTKRRSGNAIKFPHAETGATATRQTDR